MKTKKKLLAELRLMLETAQNAQKKGLTAVMFHADCIADFAESAIAALGRDCENLKDGIVRIIFQDGRTNTTETVESNAIKCIYLAEDGEPRIKEISRDSNFHEEFLLYAGMRFRCEKIDQEQKGQFAALYEENSAGFEQEIEDLDKIVKGEE